MLEEITLDKSDRRKLRFNYSQEPELGMSPEEFMMTELLEYVDPSRLSKLKNVLDMDDLQISVAFFSSYECLGGKRPYDLYLLRKSKEVRKNLRSIIEESKEKLPSYYN